MLGPCPIAFRRLAGGRLAAPEALMQFVPAASRWFTLDELAAYNGTDAALPLLLSIGGEVFDISEGARFYGPDGPYRMFAARDSTRALTKGSLDESDWSGPAALLLDDFNEREWTAVVEQVEFYRDKYRLVGALRDGVVISEATARKLGGVALGVWQARRGGE